MESIITYKSGAFSWLEMKLIWEEVDIDEAANKSALRLRDIQARSTNGHTVNQPLYSYDFGVLVNNVKIVTIPWYTMYLYSGITTEFKSFQGYSFDDKVVKTGLLQHANDTSLSAAIKVDGRFVEHVYTSPTTTQMYTYTWNGEGTVSIPARINITENTGAGDEEEEPEDGGSGSGGSSGGTSGGSSGSSSGSSGSTTPTTTVTNWLTDIGKQMFLQAMGTAAAGASLITSGGVLSASIAFRRLSDSKKLIIGINLPTVTASTNVTEVDLLDSQGRAIAIKKDSFTLYDGRNGLYYLQFDMTGK